MALKGNCGVYLIVSPSKGRYVGSSKSLKKRFNRYKNLSCHMQHALLASLKKYGFENHSISILKYCEESELFFWERVFGDVYLSLATFSNGLNIRLPGYDDVPATLTEESRERIRQGCKKRFSNPEELKRISEKAKKVFDNPDVRKRHSEKLKKVYDNPEMREKRSRLQKEYFNSPEARKKASDAAKKFLKENPCVKEMQLIGIKKYYEENPTARRDRQVKRYKDNPNAGRYHSEKLKNYYANNPEARKAASERTKLQMADSSKHPASKKVLDTETGEIIPCVISVAKRISKPIQTVRNWLHGKSPNPTSYKFI